jgi:hypothetical protein
LSESASSLEVEREQDSVDSIVTDSELLHELLSDELKPDTDTQKPTTSTTLSSQLTGELPFPETNRKKTKSQVSASSDSSDNLRSPPIEDSSQSSPQLTGAALARRLNVSTGAISRNKNKENFGQWTSGYDPDGIAWSFDGQKFIMSI